ncbi:hypothetical protein [Enterococcus sp. BWR-S5]|uniref:hypothetical protein n=1 Tax=Enterococcus sp. BWR-S5 TaxID=2787714 RepID=UPI0019210728|nr:hypothetical protein [Enterococcus sp. BWR-S5]MBL1227628.1 hypothetical protein [Enterococcus sp. BWR-S5]
MKTFFKWAVLILAIFMTVVMFPLIVDVIPVFFNNVAYNLGQYLVYIGVPILLFFLFLVLSENNK